MGLDNLADRLTKLDDHFRKAESDPFGSSLPEPGFYDTIFRGVEFFEQKAAPNAAFLKLNFEIVNNEEHQGEVIEKVYNLEPQLCAPGELARSDKEVRDKLSWLKKDLKRLGVPVDDPDFSMAEVRPGSATWDPIVDQAVVFKVTDSKPRSDGRVFRNAYIDAVGEALESDIPVESVQSMVGNGPLPTAGALPADDDIPF